MFVNFSIGTDCFAQHFNGSAVIFVVGKVMQSLCWGGVVGADCVKIDFVRRGEEEEAYAHEEGYGASLGMWHILPELGRP